MDDRSCSRPAQRAALRGLIRVPMVLALILVPALQASRRPNLAVRRVAALLHAFRNEASERRLRWDRIRREGGRGRLAAVQSAEPMQGPGPRGADASPLPI
jgi:hypothetical protein